MNEDEAKALQLAQAVISSVRAVMPVSANQLDSTASTKFGNILQMQAARQRFEEISRAGYSPRARVESAATFRAGNCAEKAEYAFDLLSSFEECRPYHIDLIHSPKIDHDIVLMQPPNSRQIVVDPWPAQPRACFAEELVPEFYNAFFGAQEDAMMQPCVRVDKPTGIVRGKTVLDSADKISRNPDALNALFAQSSRANRASLKQALRKEMPAHPLLMRNVQYTSPPRTIYQVNGQPFNLAFLYPPHADLANSGRKIK